MDKNKEELVMKKHIHVKTVLLSCLMILSLLILTACKSGTDVGKKDNTSSSTVKDQTEGDTPDITEKPLVLTMYLLGDRTVDFDKVFEKINEKLSEKINATIDVKFMSWSEYDEKYPLVFASGEDWDIIYSADWAYYNAQATKQGFWEITQEDLETYAPLTAESIYEDAWQQSKVDGKAYMLPMNYKEITSYVYLVRGDLMDKYEIDSVSTLDEVEAYCDTIAKNEPGLVPLDIGSDYDALFMFDRMWNQETLNKVQNLGPWQLMASLDGSKTDLTVTSNIYQDEYLTVVKRLKDWNERGFWSKSAPVNTQNNRESFAAGKSALALMNINTANSEYTNLVEAHPEWDIRVFDAQGDVPSRVQSFLANGMCIFSKSKNPERALMALDLLRNDEEIHNLFSYGIEGEHWQAASDDKIVSLDRASNYPYDGNCNWGIRNDKYWRTVEGGIPGLDELNEKWLSNAKVGKFETFNFNDESVKNEVAALNDIFSTDYKLLALGFTDDPEKDIEKMKEKMKAAGADKVYIEMQKQALEFLNPNQ